MTTKQHAIGTGFGVRSTTSDVLAGIDLSGKLALVTGGYSGLGLKTTRALAGAGARVVVPARRRSTAVEALDGIEGVEVAEMDLADLDSVRAFTEEFLASSRDIDILINNAGIMAAPETRVGQLGWKTPEEGAATQVWAATSPRLAGMGGVYCEDCDIAGPAPEGTELGSGVSAWAADPERAAGGSIGRRSRTAGGGVPLWNCLIN